MRRYSEAVKPKASAKQWADVRRRMSPPLPQAGQGGELAGELFVLLLLGQN